MRLALVQAAAADPVLRGGLLPHATPAPLRSLVGALPSGVLSGLGQVIDHGGLEQLRANLENLAAIVQQQPYLVADRLSLADLAVVEELTVAAAQAQTKAILVARQVMVTLVELDKMLHFQGAVAVQEPLVQA